MEMFMEIMPERVGHLKLTDLPCCDQRTLPGVISQRACSLYGARYMLAAIKDALHLIHGPIGCAYYSGVVRKKSYRVFSTALGEREIVFGAGKKLETAIREATSKYPSCSAVLVYTTCATGLIGEDVEAICKRASASLGLPVVPVNCPGFGGVNQGQGHDLAAAVLLEHFIGQGSDGQPLENSVNILGEFDVQGDLKEIEQLLQRLGLSILCAISGRATVNNMAQAHRARLNIVHCGRTGRWLAQKMEERFGIPWLKVSFFGLGQTAEALQAVAAFFNRLEEAWWIEEEVASTRQKVLPYLRRLAGKRVALFFGASRMGSMARAFKELGLEVVLCGSQFGCQQDYAESRRCLGPGTPMIDDAHQRELEEFLYRSRPDLLVGGTREKYMAHKLGIPFLVFPQETNPYTGFKGFVNLAKEVAALIRAPVWRLSNLGPWKENDREMIGMQQSTLPEGKTFKIAVATRDGLMVDEHFGRAERFVVFTLKGNKVEKAEMRPVPHKISCRTGEGQLVGIMQRLELLDDCQAVICLKAGQCAHEAAKSKGMTILEADERVSVALERFIQQYEKEDG